MSDYGIAPGLRRRYANYGRGGIPTVPTGGGVPSTSTGGTHTGTGGGHTSGTDVPNTTTDQPTSSSGGGKGGKGGGGGDPGGYKRKASARYMAQARTLQLQIEAVKEALGSEFKHALNRRMHNINRGARQQDNMLLDAYEKRAKDLDATATDNVKAAENQNFANLSNAGRERANAMSQVALQGAGESDLLQSQAMSLRNWSQNQNDVTQNALDTQRSIRSGLTDLTADTKSARDNVSIQSNADREQLMNDYYDQREQAQIQLGNLYGQQAEIYGYANEAKGSKKARKKQRHATAASGQHFMAGSHLAGMAWKNPGIDDDVEGWQGRNGVINSPAINAPKVFTTNAEDVRRPEGASLRAWQ